MVTKIPVTLKILERRGIFSYKFLAIKTLKIEMRSTTITGIKTSILKANLSSPQGN